MKSRWQRMFGAVAVVTLVIAAYWQFPGPQAGEGEVIAPEGIHDLDIMLEKLHAAQDVLTGLVKRDESMIIDSGRQLVSLCKADAWQHIEDDAVYTHFSVEFQRQAESLVRMGERKNFEGAAYVYQGLTATCIACHQHVRDIRPVQKSD